MKIAFFDAKEYDIQSFNRANEKIGYKIKFFELKLNEDTVILTKGYDVVCAFVNDSISKEVINVIARVIIICTPSHPEKL